MYFSAFKLIKVRHVRNVKISKLQKFKNISTKFKGTGSHDLNPVLQYIVQRLSLYFNRHPRNINFVLGEEKQAYFADRILTNHAIDRDSGYFCI